MAHTVSLSETGKCALSFIRVYKRRAYRRTIKLMKAAMLPYDSMRLTDEQLLAKLEKEQEKLQSELGARKAKLNARTQRVRSRLSARERKIDTRRKILVGAMMLKLADQHPETKDFILRKLDEFLDHPRDRELLDLPPKMD